jgi:hypothetical protein
MAAIVATDDAQGGEKSLRLYVVIALRADMDVVEVRRTILEHAGA